jgi:hypothetical protein
VFMVKFAINSQKRLTEPLRRFDDMCGDFLLGCTKMYGVCLNAIRSVWGHFWKWGAISGTLLAKTSVIASDSL